MWVYALCNLLQWFIAVYRRKNISNASSHVVNYIYHKACLYLARN